MVIPLHAVVLSLIGALPAVIALKQKNPFKTDYVTMVVFLFAVCIYATTIPLCIYLEGFAQKVAICISLLVGYLASFLLILIMVPVVGWVFLALLVLVALFTAYKLLHSLSHPESPRQNNLSTDHIGIQVKSAYICFF